jgi:uncharacterized protein YndB with AHSA1/START domain
MPPTHGELGYTLSQIYRVSKASLFNALIDATVLQKMWGVQQITVDARVGGRTNAVYVDGGQDWSFEITYTEVVPHSALSWVTHFTRFPMKETRVMIRLEDRLAGTELTIHMENFETPEERDANRQAWQRGLGRLAEIVR